MENTERMICLMLSLRLWVKASLNISTKSAPLIHLFVVRCENLGIFNVAMRGKR